MKQVVIFPTLRQEQDVVYTKRTIVAFLQNGATVYMEKEHAARFHDENVTFFTDESIYAQCDLLVVLGGDGSILRAAQKALQYDLPILGINLGRLGYMAELEKEELSLIENIYNGKYSMEKRMALSVGVRTKDGMYQPLGLALNDVVLSRAGYAHCVDLLLLANNRAVRTIRSDGLIVCTPTGSTAYSMSAGGSVLDPALECICVTPVCPISRYACPIVFSGESTIEIRNIDDRIDMCGLSIDGEKSRPICEGETLVVHRSSQAVKMLSLKDEGFFETLNNKISKYELKN